MPSEVRRLAEGLTCARFNTRGGEVGLVSILVTTVNMSLSSLSVFHWFLKFLSNDTAPRQNAPAISKLARPAFNELPLRKGDPKGSAWQFWGKDDELGSLNLITDEVSRAAAAEVSLGRSINLKYVRIAKYLNES
jgi:hypothetical protein